VSGEKASGVNCTASDHRAGQRGGAGIACGARLAAACDLLDRRIE